ncbi:MAG TPA: orotidine-5'-phosphate decarboxylase [Magnetospirillaceae bacterium]|jgi:orotidine-5'-phosphate decarboxylase
MTANPIFCALDTTDVEKATHLAGALHGAVGGIKLGLEFFTAHGPEGIRRVAGAMPLFLDLKLHDIPNTVAGAVRAIAPLGAAMTTIHASGGVAMMKAAAEAAKEAAAQSGGKRPALLGVTILTSIDEAALAHIGINGPVNAAAQRLAAMAQESGLDGAVCSPLEVVTLRKLCGPDFKLVVPGIRPAGSATDDQARIMAPKQALDAGADVLVIGRPITGAADPAAAARLIAESLQ